MKKRLFKNIIAFSALTLTGTLFAAPYELHELEAGKSHTESIDLFNNKWVTTDLRIENGYLRGTSTLYNNTHIPYKAATNIYVVDKDSPEKPVKIHNVKKGAAIEGVESLSKLTWKSDKVKHIKDPKAKKWQFWKVIKQTGVESFEWEVKVDDLHVDDNIYLDVRTETGTHIVTSIANAYIQVGEKAYAIGEAIYNKEPVAEINTKINELINFASEDFYVKHITKQNAATCKNLLKNSLSLMNEYILPTVKDNKEQVIECAATMIQLVTGNTNVENTDKMVDTLREIVMSQKNSSSLKDIIKKTAAIMDDLNSFDSFKNKATIQLYINVMNKTANAIGDGLMESKNADALFNGLKGIIRLTVADSNPKDVVKFINDWYLNDLSRLLADIRLSEEYKNAIDSIFKKGLNIAAKDNYKNVDEITTMIQEILEIIEDENGGSSKMLQFIIEHKTFVIDNKDDIISIVESAKIFVPEKQRQAIETILIVIKSLEQFI